MLQYNYKFVTQKVKHLSSLEKLVQEFTKLSIIKSKKYVEDIRPIITKDLINASFFGTIPFKYIN